ncbi:MAG: cytochrome c family protein [Desulfovibrio sp.]|nr:cytochrome c family protein [Desulfovibrio sp.]
MRRYLRLIAATFLCFAIPPATISMAANGNTRYVGSTVCKDCHDKEYATFVKFSKKAHSDNSIKIMAKKLSQEELRECFSCHTTGYGQPGGFVGFEQTPDLAYAGCEVCHGPGSAHVDSGGKKNLILGNGRMNMKNCEKCHNSERVANFRFKPMLYGGAH